MCALSGGRLPEALFMVFLLDSRGAKACKSCRSRQKAFKRVFTLKIGFDTAEKTLSKFEGDCIHLFIRLHTREPCSELCKQPGQVVVKKLFPTHRASAHVGSPAPRRTAPRGSGVVGSHSPQAPAKQSDRSCQHSP